MTNFLRNTINRIRRFVGLDDPLGDRYEWIRVGEVSQLLVYPLWESSYKFVTQDAVCTREGLLYEDTYDGSFVIFRNAVGRDICTFKEFPVLKKINIQRNNGMVTLDSEFQPTIEFNCSDEYMRPNAILAIRIHENEVIFARDCGKAAAEWVSQCLLGAPTGMRLGYYIYSDSMDFLATTKTTWYDYLTSSENSMAFHLDATNRYSLLSIPSFDKITDKVDFIRGRLMEYDFRPNIIIQTENEDAYIEFTWTEMKIKNVTFEVIPSCQFCSQDRLQDYFGPRNSEKEIFLEKLHSQIKRYSKVKVKQPEATLTINLKLSSQEGSINCGDPVYFKRKVSY